MIQIRNNILYKIFFICFLISLLFIDIIAINLFSRKRIFEVSRTRFILEKKQIVNNIDSSLIIQNKFNYLEELNQKPEIIGMYGSFNSETGKDEIYFNISSIIKLNSCILQYNYSLNGHFDGPFTYKMEFINETYSNQYFYSFWHTIIDLPILPRNEEYSLIVYECVLLTDTNSDNYRIYIAPNEITLTIKSIMQINLPMIILMSTLGLSLIGGIVILYKKGIIFS